MKKEQLKEAVGELNLVDTVFEADGVSYIDTAVSVTQVYDLIDQLDEPEVLSEELPVIPRFVADWIEEMKQDERPFYSVMSTLMNKTNHEWAVWKSANMNFSEIVAQAWLDGYTVEEEPKYYVSERDEEYGGFWFLSKNNNGDISIGVNRDWSEVDWGRLKLTEQEIKDYDSRYWAFAKKVEELED